VLARDEAQARQAGTARRSLPPELSESLGPVGVDSPSSSISAVSAKARQQHGQSGLLDAIVAAKPEIDHKHAHSPEELKEISLTHLRDAVALLRAKATPQELDEYKRFVVNLANTVASAHREHGRGDDPVSDTEKAAIAEIMGALG